MVRQFEYPCWRAHDNAHIELQSRTRDGMLHLEYHTPIPSEIASTSVKAVNIREARISTLIQRNQPQRAGTQSANRAGNYVRYIHQTNKEYIRRYDRYHLSS